MKVILREEVQGLGYEGDLVEVKDGYGRNFLLPQGMAVLANKANLAEWEANQEEIQAKRKAAEAKALELKELIEQTGLVIGARAGEGGRIFGSVTSQDIAAAFTEATGQELDRKKIAMEENIKELGKQSVIVKVFPEITAELRVDVVNEESLAAAEETKAEEAEVETEEVEG